MDLWGGYNQSVNNLANASQMKSQNDQNLFYRGIASRQEDRAMKQEERAGSQEKREVDAYTLSSVLTKMKAVRDIMTNVEYADPEQKDQAYQAAKQEAAMVDPDWASQLGQTYDENRFLSGKTQANKLIQNLELDLKTFGMKEGIKGNIQEYLQKEGLKGQKELEGIKAGAKYDIIEKDGVQKKLPAGDEIPEGWKITKPSSVTVNNTVDMTPRSQGTLEENIINADEVLASLDRIDESYKEEYLTYKGKAKAIGADILSKAGSKKADAFIEDREKWKTLVDEQTLKWRKFITGVAGGEKEMETIEKTTINTKYDSPAGFRSKLKLRREVVEADKKRSQELLRKGFDVTKMNESDKKRILGDNPLENYGFKAKGIPVDKETAKQIMLDAGGDVKKAMEIATQNGYVF